MAYKTTRSKSKSGTVFSKTQHTGGKGLTRSVSVKLGSSIRECTTRRADGTVKKTRTQKLGSGYTKRTTTTLTKKYKPKKPRKIKR